MNNLELKIQEIDSVLKCISDSLSKLTEENFDLIMEELNVNIKMFLMLKSNLRSEYPSKVTENYQVSSIELTKQIEQKFDNIIKEFKSEQNLIESELVKVQNQKKLINYTR